MLSTKKRDRPNSEQISPPHKMAKNNQSGTQPSNSDLMAQLTQLVAANTNVIQKIESLEKKFSIVEKLFEEVESLKKEVDRLSKQNSPTDGFRRFEIDRKQKSILLKGLESNSNKKYETRQETYDKVNELFLHLGLNLTLEDYQRLGPLKSGESGATLVRLQFWTRDDKSMLFAKFKEFSNDEWIRSISLITDYPSFQLSEVKRLSDVAYNLRQRDRAIKTRIVPRGLELRLQTRKGRAEKWMTVSQQNGQREQNGRAGQAEAEASASASA
jgi:hypothetical protein